MQTISPSIALRTSSILARSNSRACCSNCLAPIKHSRSSQSFREDRDVANRCVHRKMSSANGPTKDQDVEITVHWLNKSRSQRIVWLLEELRLKYNLKFHTRRPDGQAPSEMKTIHPLGKAPVVELKPKNRPPMSLAESGTIVEYLCDHFGRQLIPQKWRPGEEDTFGGESDEWMRYRYFMHYVEGSLMNYLATGILKNSIKNAKVPFFVKPLTKNIAGQIESAFLNHNFESNFTFLENELKSSAVPAGQNQSFLCGPNFTGADIMITFPLEAAQQMAGLTKEKYPVLTEYVTRMQEREGYKRMVKRIEDEAGEFHHGV